MTVLIGDPSHHRLNPHLDVRCRCGKKLRARPDQAGTRINCWSCHASVPVPVPVASGDWVARLFRMGARQIFDGRTFALLTIGAIAVTAGLAVGRLGTAGTIRVPGPIPDPGVWAAGLAMALVMLGYGDLIRRASAGDWTSRPRLGPVARIWRAALCLLAGAAIVAPLAIASRSHSPIRATPTGAAIGATVLFVMPLLMLGTYGATGSLGARLGAVVRTVGRHPIALVTSLLLVPLGMIVVEAVVFSLGRAHGSWAFLMLDLFPEPPGREVVYGIPYFDTVDYRTATDARITGVYLEAVRRGYAMVAAIPAALAIDTSNHYYTWSIYLTPRGYSLLQLSYTLFIVAGMLTFLAIQARWIGLLATVDSRKTEATPGSTGTYVLPQLERKP